MKTELHTAYANRGIFFAVSFPYSTRWKFLKCKIFNYNKNIAKKVRFFILNLHSSKKKQTEFLVFKFK